MFGVPSKHGRVTKDMYEEVINRVSGQLEGWKAKFLSFAGRQTLVKSVLSFIFLYPMQTTLLSMGICDKLESIIRRFLWGFVIVKELVI